MRKVIEGRTYNTGTSKCIGEHWNGYGTNDFKHCSERLYKNTKGAYFLHGQGGAMSSYATSHGNSWGWGEQIIPMTIDEAREWAEEHLEADEYEAEFGQPEEASPPDLTTRERVNLTIDSELMKAFRLMSQDTDIPMARLIDKALIQAYYKELKTYGYKPEAE